MIPEDVVTIVVPAHNAEKYLGEAIGSALAQDYRGVEVIVVDDGSTDSTFEVATTLSTTDSRVRVLSQPHRGAAAARNAALAAATGSFVCFLDADDALAADGIREGLAFLHKHPDVDIVFSDVAVCDENLDMRYIDARGIPAVPWQTLFAIRNWFAGSSALLRRDICDHVGGFDERLLAAEDWDFWDRCAQTATFAYRPGVVAKIRTHSRQTTHDFDRVERAWWTIVDRKRTEDARLGRLSLGAVHWRNANRAKLHGRRLDLARSIALMLLATPRPSEIRLILRVSGA